MNILTIGSFDGLHVGHLELLNESRRIADRLGAALVVGVNSDAFIERYKGRKPLYPYEHRVEVLDALAVVDAVVLNLGDEDAKPVIEVVNPVLLTIGDDWLDLDWEGGKDQDRYFKQLGVTRTWMANRGLGVEYIPRTKGISSSAVRNVLR